MDAHCKRTNETNETTNKQLTRNASEISETFNHSTSTGDHGCNKPGYVQKNSEGNHDPVLDRVAPPDVTLPERDLLVDRSGSGDLGNAVLELALSTVVVTPDRGNVAEDRRSNAGAEYIVITLAVEVVGLDLLFPGKPVISSTVGDGDEGTDDDKDVEGAHKPRDLESDGHGVRYVCEMKEDSERDGKGL